MGEPQFPVAVDALSLVDVGHGVQISFTSWGPHPRVGLTVFHVCTGGNCRETGPDGQRNWCGGGVLFDLPGVREAFPDRALWTVESFDPLTLSPSLQCACPGCTHHGYIRAGRWEPC